MQPHLESFFDSATSTFTHIVYDRAGGRASIVDPVLDFDTSTARTSTQSADRVLAFLREHRSTTHPSVTSGELPGGGAAAARQQRHSLSAIADEPARRRAMTD